MNNKKANSGNNNLLKSVGVIILGLILLSFFFDLFFGSSTGNGGMNSMHGGQQQVGYPGSGFGVGTLIANILLLITKILSILLAVGLIAGTWVLIRDFVLVDNGTGLITSFTNSLGMESVKCPKCGSSVKGQWDYCPDCGNDLMNKGQQSTTGNQ